MLDDLWILGLHLYQPPMMEESSRHGQATTPTSEFLPSAEAQHHCSLEDSTGYIPIINMWNFYSLMIIYTYIPFRFERNRIHDKIEVELICRDSYCRKWSHSSGINEALFIWRVKHVHQKIWQFSYTCRIMSVKRLCVWYLICIFGILNSLIFITLLEFWGP